MLRSTRYRRSDSRRLLKRSLRIESLEQRQLLTTSAYQNPIDALDVNDDELITPMDALLIINDLNSKHSRVLPERKETTVSFIDVTGDRLTSPQDVLLVINYLNSYHAGNRTPAPGEFFSTEELIRVDLGPTDGAHLLRMDIDADFGSTTVASLLPDVLSVYVVDPVDTSKTILDRGSSGTSLFSLSPTKTEIAAGIARWDGKTLELDVSSLSDREFAYLKIQRFNGELTRKSTFNVGPVVSSIDAARLSTSQLASLVSAPVAPAGSLDLDSMTDSITVQPKVENIRFDSKTGQLIAEVSLSNIGDAIGRDAVLLLPMLPEFVTLENASGVDASGAPYLNLRDAIRTGGLGKNESSNRVELRLNNPRQKLVNLVPRVLVGPANQAPQLAVVPPQTVIPGSRLELKLAGSDPDGDRLTYSVSDMQNIPNVSVDMASGVLVFQPSPEDIGSYQIEATVSDGATTTSKTFTLAVIADPITTTRVGGQVLDVDKTPLVGMKVEIGGVQTLTQADGSFLIDLGTMPLAADTIKVRGELFSDAARPNVSYPFIAEKLPLMLEHEVYSGYKNVIVRPIYLPKLDLTNAKTISPTQATVVTTAALPGTALSVAAGTLLNQQGTPFTGKLSITEVPPELTPAAIPDGLFPDLLVTIQPGEMVFTTPTPLSLPNREGRAPGTTLDLWSINPTTGEFEIVGQGQVSRDGTVIETVSGGVRNSSWHFFFQPRPNGSDNAGNPEGGCQKCPFAAPSESTVTLQTGGLNETHELPSYQSLGESRSVQLVYDSERADPRPIIHVGYQNIFSLFPDIIMTGNVSFYDGVSIRSPGLVDPPAPYSPGDNLWTLPQGQSSADGAIQTDLSNVGTGVYKYRAITRLVAGTVRTSSSYEDTYVHVNTIDSVFGSGWGVTGLKEAYVKIDHLRGAGGGGSGISYEGEVLIVDGDGKELRFVGGYPGVEVFESPSGDDSVLRLDRISKTLIHEMKDGTTYVYTSNAAGDGRDKKHYRLTSVTDRNGNKTEYKYENAFGITSIVDPVGLVTRFEYENGKVARIVDPAGRTTNLAYEGKDLASITDADSSIRSWGYDSRHHMISETTKRGFEQQELFDEFGRVKGVVREDGSTSEYKPLAIRGLYPIEQTTNVDNPPIVATRETATTAYTDASGNLLQVEIDRRGQSLSRTDSLGTINSTIRDADNNVSTSVDARGNQTTYKYDANRNVIEIRDNVASSSLFQPTSTWTGSISNKWNEPGNWKEGRVPGLSDDVLIPEATVGSFVSITALSVSLNRLYSFQALELTNSTLSVSGDSRLFESFTGTNSTVEALGAAATLAINGKFLGTSVTVNSKSGGKIVFPTLNNLFGMTNVSFNATDSGSTVSLPAYQDDTLRNGEIVFAATNGGAISVSSLVALVFPTTITASGPNSVIDLSKLESGIDVQLSADDGALIDVRSLTSMVPAIRGTSVKALSNATINLPKLAQTDRVDFVVGNGSELKLPLVTATNLGSIRVDGNGKFPIAQLTSIDGTSVFATGAAKLTFVGITTYNIPNSFTVSQVFQASGAGSEVNFPELTLTVDPLNQFYNGLIVSATDGGQLSFPKLTKSNNTVYSATGEGSRVSLPILAEAIDTGLTMTAGGLITVPKLASISSVAKPSQLRVDANGVLDLPKLTTASQIDYRVSQSAEIKMPLIASTTLGSIRVDGGGKFPIAQLTSIDGTSIYATGGAQLTFVGISTYNIPNTFTVSQNLQATGAGSEVNFPELTLIVDPLNQFYNGLVASATDGGNLSFPKLTKSNNTVYSATGEASRVSLPVLTEAIDTGLTMTAGGLITVPKLASISSIAKPSRLFVDASGVLDLPKLATISQIDFTVLESAEIKMPLITSTTLGSIRVDGGGKFPIAQLMSIDGTSIYATGGAKLSFGGVSTYNIPSSFTVSQFFQATGAGSEVNFPELTLTVDPLNQFYNGLMVSAADGGQLSFPKLVKSNNTQYSAAGDGSRVSLPVLAEAIDTGLTMTTGGIISIPMLASISSIARLSQLKVDGSGVLELPRLSVASQVDFSARDNSEIRAPLLTSTSYGSITVVGNGKFPAETMNSIDGTSVSATGGAKLSFLKVAKYIVPDFNLAYQSLLADGDGSKISFPALLSFSPPAEASGLNRNGLSILASNSGAFAFPQLSTTDNTYYSVVGNGSQIELPVLKTATDAAFNVSDGGQFSLPSLESLASAGRETTLSSDGSSSLSVPNLVSSTGVTLRASNGSDINAPKLATIEFGTIAIANTGKLIAELLTTLHGTSVSAAGGAVVTFPAVTTYTLGTAFAPSTLTADGVGTVLSFPTLLSIASSETPPAGQVSLYAVNGGRINAIQAATAFGTTLRANGAGSIVDAKLLVGLSGTITTEENGGRVLKPGEGESVTLPTSDADGSIKGAIATAEFVQPASIAGPLKAEAEQGAVTEAENLPQQFRYDPLYGQLVFSSDGRGNQTHYAIDRHTGNVIAITKSVGEQPEDVTEFSRELGIDTTSFERVDLNGDGKLDLLYVVDGSIQYSLSTGNGFGAAVALLGGTHFAEAVAIDDNGDGKLEVYGIDSAQLKLFRWTSTTGANFTAPTELAISETPTRILAADLDGDQHAELVVLSGTIADINTQVNATVSIFKNNGTGQVTKSSSFSYSTRKLLTDSIAIADFDGDGKADIAVLSFGGASLDKLSLKWGNGTTDFAGAPKEEFLSYQITRDIQVSDIDGDGNSDIIIGANYIDVRADRTINRLQVDAKPTYYTSATAELRDIVFADLDGDGIADRIRSFVRPRFNPNIRVAPEKLEIQFGEAGGKWSKAFHIDTGLNPHDLALADLNGDGTLDLSFVSGEEQTLSVRYDLMKSLFGAIGDSDDQITRFTYTPQGLVDTVTDPLGRITDYDYDQFGRVIKTTMAKSTADEAIYRNEYDQTTVGGRAGLATSTIDANGHKTTLQFDPMNRVTSVISPDPDGSGPLLSPVSKFEYDAEGNVTKVTDPLGNETRYEYNKRNMRVTIIASDPDGDGPLSSPVTRTEYDSNGNVTSVTNPLGHISQSEYDVRNRLVKSIDPDGGITRYEYDRDNNLTALIDPVGNRTEFAYDSRNRMTQETDPLGKVTKYSYDGANNLIEKIDRNGRSTKFAYDALDRLVTEIWIADSATVNTITSVYDAIGNLQSVKDAYSELTFTYDTLDRVKTVDNAGTPEAPHVVLTYTYDATGNVQTVKDTIDGVAGATTTYTYDTLDRLKTLQQTGNQVSDKFVDFSYNAIGQYTGVNRYSDLTRSNLSVQSTYVYDSLNRLTNLQHKNAANEVLSFSGYKFDSASRITQVEDVNGVTDYGYDQRDQLRGANRADTDARGDETYVYDANGNRVSTHVGNPYVTGEGNRLLSDGLYNYQYDDEGNTVRRTEIASGNYREFEWDNRNRLMLVRDFTASDVVTQEVEFSYDALNRRILKAVSVYDQSTTRDEYTHFVYDGANVILDFVDNAEGIPQASVRYMRSRSIDEVFSQESTNLPEAWLLPDHLGTIQAVASASGQASTLFAYDTFGNRVQDGVTLTRFGFTGRELDSETDLYFYRSRYLDSGIGAFLIQDTIGFGGNDTNLYRYSGNFVVVLSDPFGTQYSQTAPASSNYTCYDHACGNVNPNPPAPRGIPPQCTVGVEPKDPYGCGYKPGDVVEYGGPGNHYGVVISVDGKGCILRVESKFGKNAQYEHPLEIPYIWHWPEIMAPYGSPSAVYPQ